MKKYLILSMAALTLVTAACGNDESKNEGAKTEASTTATDSTNKAEENKIEPSITFKDGVLANDDFELTIKKSEVIQSSSINDPGLFVTFDLKNKTNADLDPSQALNMLAISQENDSTRAQLDSGYPFLDAFGEDIDKYNEMVNLSNDQRNAVLAGKTAEYVGAYFLDNKEKPVTFEALDTVQGTAVGKYEIKLK